MALFSPTRSIISAQFIRQSRNFATVSPVTGVNRNHKIVVVGGGSAGLAISHQLLRQGKFSQDDIAVVDPASWHHYQPGWTLVGGGLKTKESLRKPLSSLIDPKLRFYNTGVDGFSPDDNFITLRNGEKINYDHLVVVPGIIVDSSSVRGLSDALSNPDSFVSSTYHYDNCDKVFGTIQKLRKGRAIFTQPAGIIKCAGAPQKIMWLALDHWKRAGLYDVKNPSTSAINITFATGLPTMFGVPKYSAKLEELRIERCVDGLFQHDLIAIDGNTATFARPDGKAQVTKKFDLLHVVPKNRPHDFIKSSVIANDAGFVDVNEDTLRHQRYHNIWSAGDASNLPTSKTVAAITGQAPVLVRNLLSTIEGRDPKTTYDGYTSCPLLTEYGKVILAEFKYGGVPKETFGRWLSIDQAVPRRAFYYMKKDFFPWVYGKYMVKGTWGGPKGWIN
ncbi:Heavy metal tolerance 2 [Hyphodiscus hymeniophilus]|uniref:Heavy metal tolerance 2 n=1 Tax=Hyphodiscus hymeniophilus TaxID=353542 RepID=A0A9P6SQW3_9HELO|nr:Heavy metal tolerance 2 [Hyphodiscus hymeniophilus]